MNANLKKPQIYLSATYSDLVAERYIVLDVLRHFNVQVFFMESWSTPADQEVCYNEIDKSEICIFIFGHRYEAEVESEYDYARKVGKLCLVYIKSDDVPVRVSDIESDIQKIQRLKDLKKKLSNDITFSKFESAEQLSQQVAQDLRKVLQWQGEYKEFEKTIGEKSPQVFISHNVKSDGVRANKIADALRTKGIRVWIAPDSIKKTETWVQAIERGLSESELMIVLVSSTSVESAWVNLEMQAAISRERDKKMKILPVILEECNMPLFWKLYQAIIYKDQNQCIAEIMGYMG